MRTCDLKGVPLEGFRSKDSEVPAPARGGRVEELEVWIFIKRDHKSGPGLKGSFEDTKVGASEAPNCQTVVYYLGKVSLIKQGYAWSLPLSYVEKIE